MEKEIWKDITGYEGLYQVSNIGRVKSLPREIGRYLRNRYKILNYNIRNNRYAFVGLYNNKKVKYFSVHRLVALTFIPNPLKKSEVNHKNGIKLDNRVKNLEWVTSSENKIHAFNNGLINFQGENHSQTHLKNEDIIFIRNSKLTQNELGKIFNVDRSTIYSIIIRKSWDYEGL